MANSSQTVLDISDLKKILAECHNQDCWNKTKDWFELFGKNLNEKTKFLKEVFYTSEPLNTESIRGKIDDFNVLQGDIIKTMSAINNNPVFTHDKDDYAFYVIIPSSCSVQPGRYKWVRLARLSPLENLDGSAKTMFLQAINFHNGKVFYFPPIDNVQKGQFGFLGIFEEVSYIENAMLQTQTRVASLSDIGWHLFNAFLVNHYTRPSKDDVRLRKIETPDKWKF